MSVTKLNYLNAGLILLALTLAFFVPFELLLLSYAVLGPLHYVTEISWLHDRGYALPRRNDWILFWILAVAGAVFLPGIFFHDSVVSSLPVVGEILNGWRFDIAFLAFSAAFVMVVTRSWPARLGWALLVLVVLGAFRGEPLFIRLFAAYLPSLIHVCVFTGLFLLHGALKNDHPSGYLTFLVFLAAGAIAWWGPGFALVEVGEWARRYFGISFEPLAEAMLFDSGRLTVFEVGRIDFFADPRAIAAVRFLAFQYCYHYLNWFSKTSLIGWHRVPLSRYAYITAVWAASAGIYALDYRAGLTWLFLLSFGHFVLELPLNHRCFFGIATELRARMLWPDLLPGGPAEASAGRR